MLPPSRASSGQHPRGQGPSRGGRRGAPRGIGGREPAAPHGHDETEEEDLYENDDDFDDFDD